MANRFALTESILPCEFSKYELRVMNPNFSPKSNLFHFYPHPTTLIYPKSSYIIINCYNPQFHQHKLRLGLKHHKIHICSTNSNTQLSHNLLVLNHILACRKLALKLKSQISLWWKQSPTSISNFSLLSPLFSSSLFLYMVKACNRVIMGFRRLKSGLKSKVPNLSG